MMEFKISGKKFDPRSAVPTTVLVKTLLDKMPIGEVMPTAEMAKKLSRDLGELSRNNNRHLKEYCIKCPSPLGTVWGHPKTIEALRKELDAQGLNAY